MNDPLLKKSDLPSVVIVGRANVGKSTLWNRIVEERRAIVSPIAHTTRDRNIAVARWRGRVFEMIDTGGLDVEDDEIGRGIQRQAERAIKGADAVIFLVDGQTGVVDEDRTLAKLVKRLNKNVVLAVNKIDKPRDDAQAHERAIYGLGLGDPEPISAATGKRVGDLLDIVFSKLPTASTQDGRDEQDGRGPTPSSRRPVVQSSSPPLRLVLMGRPNVGKSSLVNAILGEERVIVSPVAHTTREPQDTPFSYRDREMVLVDTAGMRKRARVERGIEEEGLDRNRDALAKADIAFLVFDATEDPQSQDKRLAGLMEYANKGLVLVANKWDLVESKTTASTDEYESLIRQAFPFLDWAPLVFVSAKAGLRAKTLLDLALRVEDERNRIIEYNALNKFLKTVLKQKRPLASYGPKSPYIHDVAQVASAPPVFLITIRGEKQNIHASWLKFFEKKLREKF
ncbi:ribosome biogenesis GTPase Der, partial [Candidatus Uhrbacteria bacterium RIFCSPHIGHO2_12_FULL_60_25]